jgi:hypothetical protein
MARVALRGHAEATALIYIAYRRLVHQTGNALAVSHNARALQLSADARHGVSFLTCYKVMTDLCRQSDVGLLALTR